MAVYEYKCKEDHITEKRCHFSKRDEPVKCDECGAEAERIPSVPMPPNFSGSGWTERFHR